MYQHQILCLTNNFILFQYIFVNLLLLTMNDIDMIQPSQT